MVFRSIQINVTLNFSIHPGNTAFTKENRENNRKHPAACCWEENEKMGCESINQSTQMESASLFISSLTSTFLIYRWCHIRGTFQLLHMVHTNGTNITVPRSCCTFLTPQWISHLHPDISSSQSSPYIKGHSHVKFPHVFKVSSSSPHLGMLLGTNNLVNNVRLTHCNICFWSKHLDVSGQVHEKVAHKTSLLKLMNVLNIIHGWL